MGFGPKVRERRTALGFSQEHLAHQAGLSWAAVQRLEAGTIVDPHYSTLAGLARALGVTVAELADERELAVPLADAPEPGQYITPGVLHEPEEGPAPTYIRHNVLRDNIVERVEAGDLSVEDAMAMAREQLHAIVEAGGH